MKAAAAVPAGGELSGSAQAKVEFEVPLPGATAAEALVYLQAGPAAAAGSVTKLSLDGARPVDFRLPAAGAPPAWVVVRLVARKAGGGRKQPQLSAGRHSIVLSGAGRLHMIEPAGEPPTGWGDGGGGRSHRSYDCGASYHAGADAAGGGGCGGGGGEYLVRLRLRGCVCPTGSHLPLPSTAANPAGAARKLKLLCNWMAPSAAHHSPCSKYRLSSSMMALITGATGRLRSCPPAGELHSTSVDLLTLGGAGLPVVPAELRLLLLAVTHAGSAGTSVRVDCRWGGVRSPAIS